MLMVLQCELQTLSPVSKHRYSEVPVKHLLRDISLISVCIREVPLYMYAQGRSQLFLIVMTDKQCIHVNKLGRSGGMLPPESFKIGTMRLLLRSCSGQNAARISPPVVSAASEAF